MDKLFGSQCRVFRFLPFKVVFVQFDQKIGDALIFNHTLKLEIDFFSHSSKKFSEMGWKGNPRKETPGSKQPISEPGKSERLPVNFFGKKRSSQKAAGKAMRIASSGSTVHDGFNVGRNYGATPAHE